MIVSKNRFDKNVRKPAHTYIHSPHPMISLDHLGHNAVDLITTFNNCIINLKKIIQNLPGAQLT